MTTEIGTVTEPEGREHRVYVDLMGRPEECTEDCPGCHWEGNKGCEAITSGCDICDPDGVYAYAPENAEKLRRIRALADELDAKAREIAETADNVTIGDAQRFGMIGRILGMKAAAQRMREAVR